MRRDQSGKAGNRKIGKIFRAGHDTELKAGSHGVSEMSETILKLMAKVIYRLWKDDNKDLMILPGSLPLHDGSSRNELTYYLPAGWDAVIERDIDELWVAEHAALLPAEFHRFSEDMEVTTIPWRHAVAIKSLDGLNDCQ